jgi:hypothetical protein
LPQAAFVGGAASAAASAHAASSAATCASISSANSAATVASGGDAMLRSYIWRQLAQLRGKKLSYIWQSEMEKRTSVFIVLTFSNKYNRVCYAVSKYIRVCDLSTSKHNGILTRLFPFHQTHTRLHEHSPLTKHKQIQTNTNPIPTRLLRFVSQTHTRVLMHKTNT